MTEQKSKIGLLKHELRKELERRERADPCALFPWHDAQSWLLNRALEVPKRDPRIVLAAGGNRGGKSAVAKGILADTVRRKSRLARKLRMVDRLTGEIRQKDDKDPITIWVIPPTLEKARQDWVNPSDGYSIQYWLGDLFVDEKKTPDHVFYSRPPGMDQMEADTLKQRGDYSKFDKTILKSHDQDLLSFEASSVDLAIVDEEIMDEAKWNSMLLRIGTTNGTIVMAYTPLHGLSWSYERYWKPVVKLGGGKSHGDRRWIMEPKKGAVVVAVQFGAADNPLATEYAQEIEADPGMSEAEKNARLYGEYGFVEGALVPALSGLDVISPEHDHRTYVVDLLPGQHVPPEQQSKHSYAKVPGRIISYRFVTDPNKSYGATLAAIDADGNVFFIGEHLEYAWPDRLHAKAFHKMIAKKCQPGIPVQKYADPGSAGAQSIVNMSEYGHIFQNIEKGAGSVSEGVKKLRSFAWVDPNHQHPITREMGAPRLYFYRPGLVSTWKDESGRTNLGCRLADQISQARQTDNPNAPPDTPHKDIRSKLDLFDCARYTVATVMPVDSDDQVEKKHVPSNVLSLPAMRGKREIDPLDEELYVPDYFEW